MSGGQPGNPRRVFILGAGFSRQAGMPLSTELTRLLLGPVTMGYSADLVGEIERAISRIDGVNIVGHGVNVERFFDVAQHFAAHMEPRNALSRLSTMPRAYYTYSSGIVEALENHLVEVICACEKKSSPAPVERFAQALLPNDTVITFNYDTLLESSLAAVRRNWNYGLEDATPRFGSPDPVPEPSVTVLKMHGSTDWLLIPSSLGQRDQSVYQLLYSIGSVERFPSSAGEAETETFYLWRVRHRPTLEWIVRDIDMTKCRPGVAGLGRYKPLDELAGSPVVWNKALYAVSEADDVYVIGYAMSEYDEMTRLRFAKAMMDRGTPPRKVVIIDPNAEGLLPLFQRIFGSQTSAIDQRAETVDWTALLSTS